MKIIEFKNKLFAEYPMVTNENSPENIYRFEYRPVSNLIYLPDKTLDEYYDDTLNNNKASRYAMYEVAKVLQSSCEIQVNSILDKYQIVLFYLLHEEGHYDDFKKNYLEKDLTSFDFMNDYKSIDNEL